MGFGSRLCNLFYFRAGALKSGQLFHECLSLVTGESCDHMTRCSTPSLLRKQVVEHGLYMVMSCLCRATQEYLWISSGLECKFVCGVRGKRRVNLHEQYVKHNTCEVCPAVPLEASGTLSCTWECWGEVS